MRTFRTPTFRRRLNIGRRTALPFSISMSTTKKKSVTAFFLTTPAACRTFISRPSTANIAKCFSRLTLYLPNTTERNLSQIFCRNNSRIRRTCTLKANTKSIPATLSSMPASAKEISRSNTLTSAPKCICSSASPNGLRLWNKLSAIIATRLRLSRNSFPT